MAAAPTMLDRLEEEDAEHLPTCARCWRRQESPYTLDAPWCAASTTTRGRSSPSSATASAPSRRSAAAAATTAWSSSSRPTDRGVGWAAGIERILLALEDEEEEGEEPVDVSSLRPLTGSAAGDGDPRRACARGGCGAETDLAGAASRDSSSTPTGFGPPRSDPRGRGPPPSSRHVERRAALVDPDACEELKTC